MRRTMTLQGKGHYKYATSGHTGIIYIPSQLTQDSTFPLTKGPVTIKIQGKQLTITPTDKSLKQLTEKIKKIET